MKEGGAGLRHLFLFSHLPFAVYWNHLRAPCGRFGLPGDKLNTRKVALIVHLLDDELEGRGDDDEEGEDELTQSQYTTA